MENGSNELILTDVSLCQIDLQDMEIDAYSQ